MYYVYYDHYHYYYHTISPRGTVYATNEIGTPNPQLEPQITSLEKCKIN